MPAMLVIPFRCKSAKTLFRADSSVCKAARSSSRPARPSALAAPANIPARFLQRPSEHARARPIHALPECSISGRFRAAPGSQRGMARVSAARRLTWLTRPHSATLEPDEFAQWRACHCRHWEAARLLPESSAPTWPKQGAGVRISRNPASRCGRTQVSPPCGGRQCGGPVGNCQSVRTALHRRLRSGPPRHNCENPQRLDRANRRGLAPTNELLCAIKWTKVPRDDGH